MMRRNRLRTINSIIIIKGEYLMRYLYNKIDDNDDIRNFAKEYMMKPLSANGISPVNVVTNQPNSTEQVYAHMG